MEVSKLNRFLIYLIDWVISYIPCAVLSFIGVAIEISLLIYIGYACLLGYILFRDALFGGQSIGKRIMKYKAVKADGSSLSGDFATSATRNVSLLIPVISLVDCIFVITDKPRFGDNWAKTKVVNV